MAVPAAPPAPKLPSINPENAVTDTTADLRNEIQDTSITSVQWQRRKTGTTTWTSFTPTYIRTSGGYVIYEGTLTGLTYNTKFDVQSRAQNASGWSSWGAIGTFWTATPPTIVPGAPALLQVQPGRAQLISDWDDTPRSLSKVAKQECSYGTTTAATGTIVEVPISTGVPPFYSNWEGGPFWIENLTPKVTYYFKCRLLDRYNGAAAWSGVSAGIVVDSGLMVLVDNVWRHAIPYVNVDGVWKVAKPYVNVHNVWKPTV